MYATQQPVKQVSNQPRDPYVVQKIMSASPNQLISYVYDAAIIACNQQDKERALRAMLVLTDSLNYDYKEVSANYYKFYSQIQELIRNNDYAKAKHFLSDIKKTWAKAMNVY